MIVLIRGYQLTVSPFIGPACRFYPSCSQYSIEAFKTYSFPKAFLLTGWRILRCNPFNKGGYDPIKERAET